MSINRTVKRFFSLATLFLLVLLLAGTLIFADDSDGSYRLIIEKIISAEGMTEDELRQAKAQEYTFEVRGLVKSGNEYTPFNETVKVKGGEQVGFSMGNVFSASVVEMTDNSSVVVPNWKMGTSDFQSTMFVQEREAIFAINKPNGQISISKPPNLEGEPVRTYTYRIYPANQGENKWSHVFHVKNNETQTVTGVPVGEYKIEEVRTREGFNLDIQHTAVPVAAGEQARIKFVGDYGKLKLTPPNDGLPHTYELRRGYDSYMETCQPGEGTHLIRTPLTQGAYTVQEVMYDGFTGFEVSSPRTADEITFTSSQFGKNLIFNIPDGVNAQGNGVQVGFRNAQGLAAGTKYNVKLTGLWNGEAAQRERSVNFTVSANSSITYMNPPYLISDSLKFNIAKTSGLTRTTLRLNYPATAMVTEESNGSSLTMQAGNLKQLIISKPADDNPLGDNVLYHYTVTRNGYNKEFTLHAGESITLDGLTWGYNYTIKETIEPLEPKPFTLEVHDSANTSTTGSSLSTEIVNETGALVVNKPALNLEGYTDGRIYYYELVKPDGSVEEFQLPAGGSKTLGPGLAPGRYTVNSVKDTNLGFTISYNDSSMVSVIKAGTPSTIKVTNNFTREIGGYYVVHEYYPNKNSIGTEPYKERSYIFARGGKPVNTIYTDDDVELILHGPSGQEYIYYNAVYGGTTGGRKTEGAKLASQSLTNGAYDLNVDVYNLLPDVQNVNDNPYIIGSDANRAKREAEDKPVEGDIAYEVDPGMDHVVALPEDEDQQIIILRYYQAPPKMGKYKVVHAYFKRTPQGDVREGFSPIETVEAILDDTHYDVSSVARQPEHTWQDQKYAYTYFQGLYGRIVNESEVDKILGSGQVDEQTEGALRYGYQPDSTKQWVTATEKGDQVIILRYYRIAPELGSYRYVHEYYLREADGSVKLEGKSGIGTVGQLALNDAKYTSGNVAKQPTFGAFTYTYEEAAYGEMSGDNAYTPVEDMNWVNATSGGEQVIILRYYREGAKQGAYKYVHEYYLRDADGSVTLEGQSDIGTVSQLALDDTKYTVDNVTKQPKFGAFTYTYEDAAYGEMSGDNVYMPAEDMNWVNATSGGDQVIILRYYRTGTWTPPGGGGGGGSSDPGPEPEPEPEPEKPAQEQPEEPKVTETKPEEPQVEPPVQETEQPGPELPDPSDPSSPERITFEGKTYVKVWDEELEEWVYLPEDEVPLAWQEAPQTGDESKIWLWGAFCVFGLAGLAVLLLKKPRHKQD